MRVVGGVARGRPLRAPRSAGTRPTSDRVREAIFSMLESLGGLGGASVLDLYSGSGAMGVESLSRGAARAVLVESDPAAVRAIRANLEVLADVGHLAAVVCSDALRYLAGGVPPFDVVFADPPYAYARWPELLRLLRPVASLLVAETGGDWEPGSGWETVKQRRYGGTVVSIVRPSEGVD
ncbi:MAG TPA: 16S rRNA (guanine(966)-N(2))-methyltransferase RsmD [Acidimicrobiales bacterium]|nr:16S rRNA (guanine(966)-N(2))-methyltransferase RsmD [Acidimicrobiales bacterium]